MLAVVYFYVPLPEATDEELEAASARLATSRAATVKVGSKHIKVFWVTLGLAVFSQFCYVGGQESTSTSFAEYIDYVKPSIDHVSHQAIGHTAFAISRFLAAAMNVWIKPRFVLLFFYLGAVAFTAAAMKSTGDTAVAILPLIMFMEGPLFPQIFAQGIRGMGRHTKDASVLLTAAIGGGGVFPPIMFAALKIHNAQYAFCVITAIYAAGSLYPVWLNGLPVTRKLSDPKRDEQTRRESEAEEKRRESLGPRKSRTWGKARLKLSRSRGSHDVLPSIEHRERRSWPEGLVLTQNNLDITPAPAPRHSIAK
jgi:hypothetical protein